MIGQVHPEDMRSVGQRYTGSRHSLSLDVLHHIDRDSSPTPSIRFCACATVLAGFRRATVTRMLLCTLLPIVVPIVPSIPRRRAHNSTPKQEILGTFWLLGLVHAHWYCDYRPAGDEWAVCKVSSTSPHETPDLTNLP